MNMQKMTTVEYVARDGSLWRSADLCKEYEVAISKEECDEQLLWDLISADLKLEDNVTCEEVR